MMNPEIPKIPQKILYCLLLYYSFKPNKKPNLV